MGLSQYFARLDALTGSAQFREAAAGPPALRPVTRDEAAAAMAADEGVHPEHILMGLKGEDSNSSNSICPP